MRFCGSAPYVIDKQSILSLIPQQEQKQALKDLMKQDEENDMYEM